MISGRSDRGYQCQAPNLSSRVRQDEAWNSEAKGIVESIVNDALSTYFEENPAIARKIIEKAIQARGHARRPEGTGTDQKKGALEDTDCRGNLPIAPRRTLPSASCLLSKEILQAVLPSRDATGGRRRYSAQGKDPECRKSPF